MLHHTPSTPTLIHNQVELLQSLASLLEHIRHEGLELSTHSFAFAHNPRQRLRLEFEALSSYLGSHLEGFASVAIHLQFTRYIPQSLLEAVQAFLQARDYIVASVILSEA